MDNIFNIDIEELRSISTQCVNASVRMNDANEIMEKVVSEHDWKCPERVQIDESLERIKSNFGVINEAFVDFADKLTDIANGYTDYLNEREKNNTIYSELLTKCLSRYWQIIGAVPRVNINNSTTIDLERILRTNILDSIDIQPTVVPIPICESIITVSSKIEQSSLDSTVIGALQSIGQPISIVSGSDVMIF